jgi:hypothetical protein
MDWHDSDYERKRRAIFIVESVRLFEGASIENRGKSYVLRWKGFTCLSAHLHNVVHQLVYMVAAYPLDNGPMVRTARSLLSSNGYELPAVRRSATYPGGLTCKIR